MGFKNRTSVCTVCNNENECTRYCTLHAGKALYEYINGLNLLKAKIGAVEAPKGITKDYLMVTGYRMWNKEDVSSILNSIKTSIVVENKLGSVFNVTAAQLITDYCVHACIDVDTIRELRESVIGINENKQLNIPFELHSNFKIRAQGDSTKLLPATEAELVCITWKVNSETNRLECILSFETVGTKELYKFNIAEYLTNFVFSMHALRNSGTKINNSVIKFDNYGRVKPIVFKSSETREELIVDGTYVYRNSNGCVSIIGYWTQASEIRVINPFDKKLMTVLSNNAVLIKNHRKYIGPYVICEGNEILVK